uniref:Putative secreted protein n=1 Tax=Panstrongylus lignarius TaxID=156445 RepID=A0A224XW72_9HEMI
MMYCLHCWQLNCAQMVLVVVLSHHHHQVLSSLGVYQKSPPAEQFVLHQSDHWSSQIHPHWRKLTSDVHRVVLRSLFLLRLYLYRFCRYLIGFGFLVHPTVPDRTYMLDSTNPASEPAYSWHNYSVAGSIPLFHIVQ